MRDVVCCEEGGDQVGDGTGLAAMGTELEGVQASLPEQREAAVLSSIGGARLARGKHAGLTCAGC